MSSYFIFCWVLRVSHSARPQQPPAQSWHQDPDRPSIVSATELKELDNLDNDADEGWAGLYIFFCKHHSFNNWLTKQPRASRQSRFHCYSGAQMEVDYTEKLNFSDDEENQASKDKRDWWVELPYLIQYCFI